MFKKLISTALAVALISLAVATDGLAYPGNKGGGSNIVPLTPTEEVHVLFMREEEKLARDSYLELHDIYDRLIFDNIAASEQSHMDAIKNLLDKYGLEDPVLGEGDFFLEELQDLYDSLMAKGAIDLNNALEVGAWIEETDIVAIQHAIDDTEHEDIISTYESLMCGSRNHLRAFVGHIESVGYLEFYEPLGEENGGLDEEELWEIADSEMERNCGNHEDDDDGDRKREQKGQD